MWNETKSPTFFTIEHSKREGEVLFGDYHKGLVYSTTKKFFVYSLDREYFS